MDGKIAHLGFIQGVITRMAANAAQVKGWSVALIAAVIALSASTVKPVFILSGFIVLFVFWWLDSYYLHQEKLYRKLYDEVVGGASHVQLFSMDVTGVRSAVPGIFKAAISISVLPFYMLMLIILSVLGYSFNVWSSLIP